MSVAGVQIESACRRARRLCLLLALLSSGSVAAQSAWQYSNVERVVAVADIHGAYDAFVRILSRAGIIDESERWIGGTSHLVIAGDVLDRGPDSRRALELIQRLEPESEAVDGQVHLVLGNHEVMNLTGDLRYVSAAEFAAFAADETPEQREAGFARFAARQDPSATEAEVRAAFDENFPPGYFAHRAAFAPRGAFGSWLVDKPMILVVDDVAFVHGGLAGAAAKFGTNANAALGRQLSDYVNALDVLIEAGVLGPTDSFFDHAPLVSAWLTNGAVDDSGSSADLRTAAMKILESQSAELYSPDGPIWYRGNVACNRLSEPDRLGAALDSIGAERLVVGHTPTPGALVLSRFGGELLRIDTGMLHDYYGGRASALVFANGTIEALYEDETAGSAPVPQARRVGNRPAGLAVADLEAFLERATVTEIVAFDATAKIARLSDAGLELLGLFTPQAGDGNDPPVAAYRLDRLLGLDMVPVTVARAIEGEAGSLQFLPADTIGERERSAQNLGGSAWCPFADQIRDMYVFDALIYNEARTADRIRYSTDSLNLLLVGHDRAFANSSGRPAYLAQVDITLTDAWRKALGSLDDGSIAEALGDVLGRRQLRALLERRDELLTISP